MYEPKWPRYIVPVLALILILTMGYGVASGVSSGEIRLPLVLNAYENRSSPPTARIVIDPPPGITIHATNTQIIIDSAGVIWAATRANTSIGGVVWRVDGYIDENHRGTPTYVLNDPAHPEPAKFFGNGELVVYPDGYLYYITVEVDDVDPSRRNVIGGMTYPVQGWTR